MRHKESTLENHHYERFEREMAEVAGRSGQRLDAETLGRWYDAELLWDEYVAASIAGYLGHHEGRLVVLAGTSHVRAKDGVPDLSLIHI